MYDDIGTRMKTYYEQIPKINLMRRMPVAIRIDGKSFHTFTKGFEKPFDSTLMSAMQATMQYLCENIQGCVIGYNQSDEITLILIDYQKLNSGAWFDYEVQKLCSISASMATRAFNKYFREIAISDYERNLTLFKDSEILIAHSKQMYQVYSKVFDKAMFDARCFNIPKEEVANLLYWRQLDATRNSIQAVGQKYFSNKQLHGKSCNAIQDMLLTQRDINWNDYTIPEKRGSCCIKDSYSNWFIDKEIPIFKNEGRDYIERLIYFDEE